MSSFGYYPHYYNYQHAGYQQMYFPSESYSTASEHHNNNNNNEFVMYNESPIAAGWVNQGLNATTYNPYQQQQPTSVSWMHQPYQTKEYGSPEPSYTQQSMSHKSQRSTHDEDARSRISSSSHSQLIQATGEVEEDMSQLTPQIEAAYEEATGKRRQPVVKRQVITMPGEAGRIQQIVRRLPTPTPDVIERVFIVKPQRDMINLVIERPATPPVQYRDKTVYGKSRRPIINPKVVTVQPRSMYPQIEGSSTYQQSFQSLQDYTQMQSHQMESQQQQQAEGYLIAPVRYDEQQQQQQQAYDQHLASYSQVLQPYTTQMFDYQPQQYTYNYGTQLF